MEFKEYWHFPVPSGGYIGKVELMHKTADASILFDYFDEEGTEYNGGILFSSVKAYKNATEKFFTNLGGAYDTLIEYTDSKWVTELYKQNPEKTKSLELRHFAIYLEDYGLYEVIASDFKILEIKEGPLKD